MTPQEIEAASAKNYKAPRVTLDDITAAITSVHYATADQLMHGGGNDYRPGYDFKTIERNLSVMSICLVVMKNGFVVIGKAAPASPENFDAAYGRQLAYDDAVKQIWPLMGFALKDRLHDVAGRDIHR